MSAAKNLLDQRFGRLVVISEAGRNQWQNVLWRCRCDCGKIKTVKSSHLSRGLIKSCGCLQRDTTSLRFKAKLLGKRFGKLLVIGEERRESYVMWLCQCDCGKTTSARSADLIGGYTKSCGCRKSGLAKIRFTTHGRTGSKIYEIWSKMKSRCNNPDDKHFSDYGGRGITVCERWKESFAIFLADMGERPTGKTLHRKDNDQGYSPENCEWASDNVQRRAKRSNRFFTLNGETLCLMDWARRVNIAMSTLHRRLAAGWSIADTLTIQPKKI